MLPHRFFVAFFCVCTAVLTGCGGTIFIDRSKLPDTYQCAHMDEVCKESQEFEHTYEKLSPDEKKEAETVLKAYRLQCESALEMCKKSGKKR